MLKLPLGLVQSIVDGICIPFIGAGFSKNCSLSNKAVSIPLWPDLIRMMCADLGINFDDLQNDADTYLDVAEKYNEQYGRPKLIQFIRSKIPVHLMHPGYVHKLLIEMFKFDRIITTNYDNLIEKTIELFRLQPRIIATPMQLQVYEHEENTFKVIKIHGDFENPDQIVATKTDYQRFFDHPQKQFVADYLKNLFRSNVILLLGYSGIDPDYKQITDYRSKLGEFSRKIYLVNLDFNSSNDTIIDHPDNIVEIKLGCLIRSAENAIIYFLRGLFNAVQRVRSGRNAYLPNPTYEELKLPHGLISNPPATEEEINSLEHNWTSDLPNSFRNYLKQSNGAVIRFKGENGKVYEEELFSIKQMTDNDNTYEKHLLPFYAVGNGDFWCLNLHEFHTFDECSVHYWDHNGQISWKVNESFYELINDIGSIGIRRFPGTFEEYIKLARIY